jgi:diguanylate cyclase (GGDEF)-like protein
MPIQRGTNGPLWHQDSSPMATLNAIPHTEELADHLFIEEEDRLKILESYHILDTEEERAYDDLTYLASTLCATSTALITFIDRDRQWIKSRVNWGKRENPRDVSFCAQAILEPASVTQVCDAATDVRFAHYPCVANAPHVRFYAGVPLLTREGAALGTICVMDEIPRLMTGDQEEALRCLARQVMAQLELRVSVSELEQQTLIDPLTGSWNRRAYQRMLREEWAKASRTGAPLAMLMIDIDHFKMLNDKHGHPAGDVALKQVARLLTKNLRPTDRLVRYGGEEFCCLLPECSIREAEVIAERARDAISSAQWEHRPVTVSIGVSETLPIVDDEPNLLIARADSALYLAKNSGRNRVNSFRNVSA